MLRVISAVVFRCLNLKIFLVSVRDIPSVNIVLVAMQLGFLTLSETAKIGFHVTRIIDS